MLEIASNHSVQFQGKLINQTWENGKKPSFRPDFGPNLGLKIFFSWISTLLDVRHCYKLLFEVSRKTNEPNFRKWQKKLVSGTILAHLAQIPAAIFLLLLFCFFVFFKNLALSVTRYHGQLSSCTISDKTNDPILRELSERRTDRGTTVIS